MYFIWISTASCVALMREGSKTCFNSINTKLMQHRFIKSLVLKLDRIGHSEKRQRSSLHEKSVLLKFIRGCK